MLAHKSARRWSRGDSNPGPPPCKGGALPTKLRPPPPLPGTPAGQPVGAPGLEPGTSALSGPRSNQLSYAPPGRSSWCASHTKRSAFCAEDEAASHGCPYPGADRALLEPAPPRSPGAPARPRTRAARPPRPEARSPEPRFTGHGLDRRVLVPRKEVIQPQLPLRLPCYDFVPITSPTLDSCPPEGLAHRLQVLPAFMT